MFEEIIAQYGTKFVIATAAVLLGLACLALVLLIVRRRPSSPFIRGGRNRQPRLSVLDAAAVDTRRRLVLVRRDDVEHLLMIGGPTDIVVESRIVGASTIATEPPAEAVAPPAQRPVAVASPKERPATTQPAAARAQEPALHTEPTVRERQPEPVARPVAASGVSSMGQVLYGSDEEPVRLPAQRPVPTAPEPLRAAPGPAVQQPIPMPAPAELNAIDALDRARERVLTSPVGTGSERPAVPLETAPAQAPAPVQAQRPATDNAALVSEFERILEAEIAATPRPTAGVVPGARVEPAPLGTLAEQPKTREETEAEMARLLGELSANRKS